MHVQLSIPAPDVPNMSRPVRMILVGGFFTKLRWTFPEGEARIRSYSMQNVLLGGSGGMPPQENFGF